MTRNATPTKWMLGLAAFGGMSVLGVLTLAMIGALNTGMAGLVVGLILATLPVPLYLALALRIDRYEKEPAWMMASAFFWGATGAVFFSFILNSIAGGIFGAVGGEAAAEIGSTVVSAPVVEELAKGAALLLFFFWKKDEFDNVTDGILYATLVGLGFAMTENVSYYGTAMREAGVEGSVGLFVLRGMLAPFAHPLFTAMTGIGLGLARETRRGFLRGAAPLAGVCAAMLLHAAWNLFASLDGVFFAAYVVVMVPAFLLVVGLVLYSQARERKIIRANLLPYVQTGVISPADLEALCRTGGRVRARLAAMRAAGVAGWRREGRFHQAASELAFHHWRRSRGITTGPQVDDARHAACLEQIRAARG